MIINPLMEEVYGKENTSILGLADGGAALMYLVRRFGYTEYVSDPQKRICMYVIPTEHEKVQVHISFSATSACFGVALGDPTLDQYHTEDRAPFRAWHDRCRAWAKAQGTPLSDKIISTEADNVIREAYKEIEPFPDYDAVPEPGTVKHAVHTAVRNALQDLLRPVFVRDVPINILGEYDGEMGEWSEEDEKYDNTVLPHWSAGIGIIQEPYHDFDLFYGFLKATKAAGDGDLQRGMKLALVGMSYERPEEIEFLRDILAKLETRNYHDRDEAEQMLRDQIAYMEKQETAVSNVQKRHID